MWYHKGSGQGVEPGSCFSGRQVNLLAHRGTARNVAGLLGLIVLMLLVGTCMMYVREQRRFCPLPDNPARGWHLSGTIERYAAGDMYLKIGRAADSFQQFDVQQLRFATYAREGTGGVTVEVYCYDMASRAHALAAYQSEKSAGASAVPAGDGGHRSGASVSFLRGSSYVQVIPIHHGEADEGDIRTLAAALGGTR